MTNKEIDALIEGIYEGSITAYVIPESLYYMIARRLLEGLYEGYGATMATVEMVDEAMLTALRTNVFQFSAAKSYQQLQVMSEKLAETGVFSEFKKEAKQVFETYNKTWLKTEYDTAIGQAQNIVKWQEIEKTKDILPYLRYSAIIDPNTSEICRPLDGIVAKVDDPIWQKIAPLNHFNCRCLLLQEFDAVESPERQEVADMVEKDMQPLFKHNPYYTKQIFDKDHPYFQVPAQDKEFARTNFGLPIPKNDNFAEL
jgi:SPP1 gp7 family putative phage head morphogenesis protein